MTTRVDVPLAERSYAIHVASGGLSALAAHVCTPRRPSLCVVVGDGNVAAHARTVADMLRSAGLAADLALVPPGESSKSLEGVSLLYDRLAELRADRKSLVVAVGGGVVGDLAGFAAATFNRGVGLFMVPTTLLAMVDSSVGGKVGINHPRGKNLIGAFHQPTGVLIDTDFLDTLPDREYRSGLAEVVKYGVILDADFFAWLEGHVDELLRRDADAVRHVVAVSCRLKASVVSRDERETTGLRAVLNYGHTFAHAFEAVAGYGAWLHGEAVSAGMVGESRLAERLGMVPEDVTSRQVKLLERLGLPTRRETAWDVGELVEAMRSDKKNEGGSLRFVLPTCVGAVEMREVAEAEVRAVAGGR